MIVSAIVAASQNDVIGKDGELPWQLPADLKYFKRKTLDHHIIMGRKTFLSIGRPLPKRVNVVVTRDPFFIADGILVAHSIYEALVLAHDAGEEEVFIIGGGQIYESALCFCDRIYLTRVGVEIEGDTVFPRLPATQWRCISSEAHPADEKNTMPYAFEVYERLAQEEE